MSDSQGTRSLEELQGTHSTGKKFVLSCATVHSVILERRAPFESEAAVNAAKAVEREMCSANVITQGVLAL